MLSSGRRPVFCALEDQPTLELRNGPEDMEQQLACGGGCINPLLQADQIDLSGFDVRDRTIRLSCRSRRRSDWITSSCPGISTGILVPQSAKLHDV